MFQNQIALCFNLSKLLYGFVSMYHVFMFQALMLSWIYLSWAYVSAYNFARF
jgi:hypothetical protein